MFKFIKERDLENEFDVSTVSFEVISESRSDLIEEFINFLSASGFYVEDLKESFDL